MHFTLFLAKSKSYMKHHSNWHWIDTATTIFMIPQNLRKDEQYYRNFRPLTRVADYAGISGHPEGSTPGQPKDNPRA